MDTILVPGPIGVWVESFAQNRSTVQSPLGLDSSIQGVFPEWVEATSIFFLFGAFLRFSLCPMHGCIECMMVCLQFWLGLYHYQSVINCSSFKGLFYIHEAPSSLWVVVYISPKRWRFESLIRGTPSSIHHWRECFFFIKHPIKDWEFKQWGIHFHWLTHPPLLNEEENEWFPNHFFLLLYLWLSVYLSVSISI